MCAFPLVRNRLFGVGDRCDEPSPLSVSLTPANALWKVPKHELVLLGYKTVPLDTDAMMCFS